MSSDYPEVLRLVNALATKVSESQPVLVAQAVGSALYGLQQLSSDHLEVRTLVATLAEKLETSTLSLDAQAIGNALFGLQRMNSNSAEVRLCVCVYFMRCLAPASPSSPDSPLFLTNPSPTLMFTAFLASANPLLSSPWHIRCGRWCKRWPTS